MKRIELHFPVGGLFKRVGYQRQSPYYTIDAQNVRPDDTIEGRERGGSRPGMVKTYSQQFGSGNKVNLISDVSYVVSSAVVTQLVAASNGVLSYDSSGTMTTQAGQTIATTNTPTATDWNQKLYIASNSSGAISVYDPSAGSLGALSASAGTLPTNCYLIDLWRDRLVLAGDTSSPHLWYMLKQGDPTNADYTETGYDRAINATNSRAGRMGEPIRAVIPHGDDCIVFGCSTSVYVMRGDPALSGSLDALSRDVGILDRKSWCMDPEERLWFWSPDGLYVLTDPCGSSGKPVSVSREVLPEELLNIDRTSYTVTMAYDFRFRGIHLSVADNSSTDSTHYWIDTNLYGRTNEVGFWPQTYQNDHDPFALYARRDDASSTQSLVRWGGRDGYIRHQSTGVDQDDGSNAISSYVYYGPIALGKPAYYEGVLETLIGETDSSSGDIDWTVYVGDNAQDAYNASAFESGEWNTAGVQNTENPKARGTAAFVKLSNGESNDSWAIETMHATIREAGEAESMTLPVLRPRIPDNPTCNNTTMRRSLEVLQEQCDGFANNLSAYASLTGLYGVATRSWSSLTLDLTVNPCESDGSNPDTGTTHTVLFYPTDTHSPNVVVDQVIMYWLMSDGTYATTCGMDDKIGRITMVRGPNHIPEGWAVMNGSDNNVGTGWTMSSRFARGVTSIGTLGDLGGSATHQHDVTTDLGGSEVVSTATNVIGFAITNTGLTGISIDAHTSTEVTDCIQDHTKTEVADCIKDHAAADVVAAFSVDDHSDNDIASAIDDHDDHAHEVPGSEIVDSEGTGTTSTVPFDDELTGGVLATNGATPGSGILGHSSTGGLQHNLSEGTAIAHAPHDSNDPLEHNPVSMQTITHTVNDIGHTHNLTDPGHAHNVTLPDHQHTGSTDFSTSLPPYRNLYFIERIDNSTEVTGL